LRRDNAGRIGQAWALGRSSADKPSGVASTLFRRAYSHEPRIHFIGIWDPQFAETASPAARPGPTRSSPGAPRHPTEEALLTNPATLTYEQAVRGVDHAHGRLPAFPV
jgi:hypothetical protein